MSTITSYSELLTQIGVYLGRSDYTAQAPVWVTLAHNKIVRESKVLGSETKLATFSINAEYVSIPSDFEEVRSFRINSVSPNVVLEFKTDDMITRDHSSGTGTPHYYCVTGGTFRFGPAPDATYTATLTYHALPATLVVTSQESNSVFSQNPDLYLYGSLLEACAQYGDDPRIPKWKAGYDEAMEKLNKYANRRRWGGAAMATRPG